MDCRRVIVVTQDTELAGTLSAWLTDAGLPFAVATTFAAAKDLLDTAPALLIAGVKLGAYNGLHVALRAREKRIPALIIGDGEMCTAREAEQVGAAYMAAPDVSNASILQSLLQAIMLSPGATIYPVAAPASFGTAGMAHGTDIYGGS